MLLISKRIICLVFSIDDTPGTGTFYDFHRQLWLSDNKNLSEALHPPKEKPQKPNGKEEKAAPVEKVMVEDLFRQFEMIRLVAVRNGNWNLMQGLLRNAVTNVRK